MHDKRLAKVFENKTKSAIKRPCCSECTGFVLFKCETCDAYFQTEAALKHHSNVSTAFCFLCELCLNDQAGREQLLRCIEGEHCLQDLKGFYENAVAEWWEIFTCDPYGSFDWNDVE